MNNFEVLKNGFAEFNSELSYSIEDRVAKLIRIAPRSKLGYKVVFNYRFHSVERMLEYIQGELNRLIANRDAKAAKEVRKIEEEASVAVGDIFHNSWGCGMSLHDFYQVVARKGKSIIVRELNCEVTKVYESGFRYDIKPIANDFRGGEIKFRLNGASFKVNSFSYASKLKEEDLERSFYVDKLD